MSCTSQSMTPPALPGSWGLLSPLPTTGSNQAVLGLGCHLVAGLRTVCLPTSPFPFFSFGVLWGWGHICVIISIFSLYLFFVCFLFYIPPTFQSSSFFLRPS